MKVMIAKGTKSYQDGRVLNHTEEYTLKGVYGLFSTISNGYGEYVVFTENIIKYEKIRH